MMFLFPFIMYLYKKFFYTAAFNSFCERWRAQDLLTHSVCGVRAERALVYVYTVKYTHYKLFEYRKYMRGKAQNANKKKSSYIYRVDFYSLVVCASLSLSLFSQLFRFLFCYYTTSPSLLHICNTLYHSRHSVI